MGAVYFTRLHMGWEGPPQASFEETSLASSRQRISACSFAELRTNGFLIDLRTEESRPGDRRDADEGLDQVGLGLLRVAVRVAHGGPFPRPIAH